MTDEESIRQLVARYADAVNRRDEEAYAATWTDDAVWDLGRHHAEGRTAIVELWRRAMAPFEVIVQLVHQGVVAVDGDTATGRWYLHDEQYGDGMRSRLIGVYDDSYRRSAAGWQFTHRRYKVLLDAS